MAGYGNRTAPSYTPEDLSDQHSSTRLGLTDSHTTPTYGAGFGNKQSALSPSTSEEKPSNTNADANADEADAQIHRFNTQSTHGNAPYTHAHTYGSASTAGAGWGNKTGGFDTDADADGGDAGGESRLGRVLHKAGAVLHSPSLTKKGAQKDVADAEARADGLVAN